MPSAQLSRALDHRRGPPLLREHASRGCRRVRSDLAHRRTNCHHGGRRRLLQTLCDPSTAPVQRFQEFGEELDRRIEMSVVRHALEVDNVQRLSDSAATRVKSPAAVTPKAPAPRDCRCCCNARSSSTRRRKKRLCRPTARCTERIAKLTSGPKRRSSQSGGTSAPMPNVVRGLSPSRTPVTGSGGRPLGCQPRRDRTIARTAHTIKPRMTRLAMMASQPPG